MYGTQTMIETEDVLGMFENDVKMYGTQTCHSTFQHASLFENDVKMYGTQTREHSVGLQQSLRMM